MSDTDLSKIIQYGTAAARVLFVPSPPAGIKTLYIWHETDGARNTYVWDGTTWQQISGQGQSAFPHAFLLMGS